MDLRLEPPHGVGPVRLGMTFDEAVAAVAPWDGARSRVRPGTCRGRVSASCGGIGAEVLLEEDDRVTAVELWWPGEGRSGTSRVLLDGRDVFATPADDLLAGLDARDADGEDPYVPGLSLGFTRRTSQEVPRRPDGLPVHFTSVLVGGADYYDFRL
ncbi:MULTISPECIES: hypothetical protein [Streptomyces]|uniref:Uncharacterized protein n=2 Tax=Streptomyces TaxID=1883 RepID=A0ABU4KBS5_9ACTN|nr:hypothetical protein [Streptomyces roseolus]MDX2295224.1 hypothetical protein [Streptomyces roseolus]